MYDYNYLDIATRCIDKEGHVFDLYIDGTAEIIIPEVKKLNKAEFVKAVLEVLYDYLAEFGYDVDSKGNEVELNYTIEDNVLIVFKLCIKI